MQVNFVRLDQSLALSNLDSATYIIVQLPTGVLIRAKVDDEAATAILAARAGSEEPASVPETSLQDHVSPEQPVFQQQTFAPLEQAPDADVAQLFQDDDLPGIKETSAVAQDATGDERMVEWALLSDEILTPPMKKILRAHNYPAMVPYAQLVAKVQDVISKMPPPRVNPNAPNPNGGQIPGQVSFRHQREIPPIRSVPKDGAGNPLPPKRAGQVDHSDITTGTNFDEDGVGQV